MVQAAPKLGQSLELTVDSTGHDGQGVGRWNGLVVFLPGVLPGERVQARVRRVAKRHLEADLTAVLESSPQRRRPPCILADHCGGCSLQHCEDSSQAGLKQQLVVEALRRLGGVTPEVDQIWSAEVPLGYRNRALIPLERSADGQLRAGYYRRGSHRIVNMNRCPVLDPRIDRLVEAIKRDLAQTDWPVDVNLTAQGGLRHLALRVGHHTGEVLITLVSSHADLPGFPELAQLWMQRWPEVVGVGLNLQPRASNVVLGPCTTAIRGRPWLLERFAGIELRIAADTFFQVNTPQAERLVPLLVDFLDAAAGPRLVDAYCGIGTFALPLAAAGAEVLGLELHAEAVSQAQANAQRNGLPRARFLQGDVGALLQGQLSTADGLVVDPPRKGLSDDTLAAIVDAPPPRLAYISCNPATLARDLGSLCGNGPYGIERLQPVDFFPQTSHVECVALLQRR
ncbi:MAG: rRNA ((1939)-C(5))-methyltransferase RlmD [Cyanobacteriota bacterium]